MRANELSAPAGESFKFENIGDTLEGVVTFVGPWQHRTNKFDKQETVAKIGIDAGGGQSVFIYPAQGSSMAQAIADALRASNVAEFTEGQTLKLRYDSNKDVGKGNPMKVYRAKVTPGERPSGGFGGSGPLIDEEPFIRDASVGDF